MKTSEAMIIVLIASASLLSSLEISEKFNHVAFIEGNETAPLKLWTRGNIKQAYELTAVGENVGLMALTSLMSKEKRFNMEPLTASAFHFDPYTLFQNGKAVGGLEFNIAADIAKGLNLQLEVRPPLDGRFWGRESPLGSGNFTGLLGELGNGLVDVGWAHLFVQPDRLRVMDFSLWYKLEMTCVAVPKPQRFLRLLAPVLPFDLTTWILLIVMVVAVMGIFILHSMVFKSGKNLGILIVAVLCSASHPATQRITEQHLRLGMGFVLFCTFVLANGYSGSLVSMLTIEEQPPPLNTLSALAKAHREEEIGDVVTCCTRVDRFLAASEVPVLQYLSKNTKKGLGSIAALHAYLRRLNDERTGALFYTDKALEFFIRRDLLNEVGETNVHVMSECFLPGQIAFGFKKRSLIKHRFDDLIIILKEAGLIEKYIKNSLDSLGKLREDGDHEDDPEPLSLDEMQGPIILMICAQLMATFVLVGELATCRLNTLKAEMRKEKRMDVQTIHVL